MIGRAKVDRKVQDWLKHGTKLVWVVDPTEKTVSVHPQDKEPVTLFDSDTLTAEPLLPGFACPVAEIFNL